MEDLLNSPKAVGIYVKFKDRHGALVTGKVTKVHPGDHITVELDPEHYGEWDEATEDIKSPYRGVKLDYDPAAARELLMHWERKTGFTAGPYGPIRGVRGFLTGRARKTRKGSKKSRKTRKSPKRI